MFEITNLLYYLSVIMILYYSISNEYLNNTIFNKTGLGKILVNIGLKEGYSTNQLSTSLLFYNTNPEITLTNPDKYPIYKLGTAVDGTYPPNMGKYFRKSIFPTDIVKSGGSLENILRLQNGEIDYACVDEDILLNFIGKEDKYLKQSLPYYDKYDNNIKFIASLYYQPMILITKKNTGILDIKDLKNGKRIGVTGNMSNSFFHLVKLLKIANVSIVNDVQIFTYDNQKDLIKNFNSSSNISLDAIYMTTNQKNEELLNLSKEMELRFISPFIKSQNYIDVVKDTYQDSMPIITYQDKNVKKWSDLKGKNIGILSKEYIKASNLLDNKSHRVKGYKLISYSNIDSLINGFIGNSDVNVSIIYIGNKSNRMELFEKLNPNVKNTLYYLSPVIQSEDYQNIFRDLDQNRKQSRDLIKKQFPYMFPKTLDLNHFYQNINTTNYIETYASRMLLVCRSNLNDENVAIITDNIIKNLSKLQKNINEYLMVSDRNVMINNVISDAFVFNELASANKELEIHPGAAEIYQNNGLISYLEVDSCPVEY